MLKPTRGARSSQARLLDRFVTTLRRDRRAARPPAELDQDLARMAAYVELEIEPRLPDVRDAFAGTLWRRISATPETTVDLSWNGPAVDPTRLRRPVATENDESSGSRDAPSVPHPPEPFIVFQRRRWASEVLRAAAALLAFLVVGGLLTLLLRGEQERSAGLGPEATGVATSTITSTPTPPSVSIPVGERPVGIAAGAGAVWITDTVDGLLRRIDPASNQVVATIEIQPPADPNDLRVGAGMLVAVGGDRVWVTRYDTTNAVTPRVALLQIDPATNEIVSIAPLDGAPLGLAADADHAWIAANQRLYQFDGDGVEPVTTIPPVDGVCACGAGFSVGWDGTSNGELVHIDPATGQTIATIDIGIDAVSIVNSPDAVWVLSADGGQIVRIDPAGNQVVAHVDIGAPVLAIAWDQGSLWALETSGLIAQFDPGTSQVVRQLDFGMQPSTSAQLAAGDGSLWVNDTEQHIIIRVNP
ncbi:MAG TPA: hypothetical protein VFV93_03145 [Thermomicrobiales bacterium]|nr:hypothetical protein [Thermomicrobiales bacterium]